MGGHLANPQTDFLPTCSTETPAELVLRIDNRLGGGGQRPSAGRPNHPCGSGTVHTCTLEPDTDFLGVRIIRPDGTITSDTPVAACGNVPIGEQDVLQVDFFAHDPDGHLAYYTLLATYGRTWRATCSRQPSLSLTPLGAAPVPPAAQVGPTYAAARLAGAAAPTWRAAPSD